MRCRNRGPSRLLLACAASMAAIVIPASPAGSAVTAPADGYGFSVGSAWDGQPVDVVNRELDAVSQTGATWLRVLIDWNRIEPAKGRYDWSHLDAVVDAALRHNLRVLGLIAYTAEWARPTGSFFTAFPVDATDYGEFAAAVASRYADRVSSWQLWNEPNLPQFSGMVAQNGTSYTELLKAAYPAVKAVQPDSTVVTAALSRTLGAASPPAFFTQMYAAGAKGLFDAAAAHPYVFPFGLATDPDNGWSDVARLHDVMAANGDGDLKIWLTEFGAPTSDPAAEGVSQAEQAEQIRAVLAAAAATSYSGPAFIYSIRDMNTSDPSNREMNFGALLTTDWQPKAAAAALAR